MLKSIYNEKIIQADAIDYLLYNINNNNQLYKAYNDIENLYINYFKYNKIVILDE